jgi:hypothetical protein
MRLMTWLVLSVRPWAQSVTLTLFNLKFNFTPQDQALFLLDLGASSILVWRCRLSPGQTGLDGT